MQMTRPRLIASGLSALFVVLLGIALFAASRSRPFAMHDVAEDLRTFDIAQAPPPPAEAEASTAGDARQERAAEPGTGAIAVTVPRIAYTYGYTFRLDGGRVAAMQERHLALCRRLGPARCRVASLRRGSRDGDAGAELKLQVAAPLAEAFGRGLMATSAAAGAETVDRSIAAEDLSRQIVDSAARIRTREVLIRRLTGLLETRSGNIAQAVEAERAINNAQEELDAARNWLAEMHGRLAMSEVDIAYLARAPAAPRGANPVGEAIAQVGTISLASIGAMILLLGVALPWLLFAGGLFLLGRVVRRRFGQAIEKEAEI